MKIAVTYENGNVFQHFGRTEQFKVYDAQDGKIVSSAVIDNGGQGHEALAFLLSGKGVDVLICGGMGMGARMALEEAGVEYYGGVQGSADEAVNAFLAGNLVYDPDVSCDHHGEDHDCAHDCGRECSN